MNFNTKLRTLIVLVSMMATSSVTWAASANTATVQKAEYLAHLAQSKGSLLITSGVLPDTNLNNGLVPGNQTECPFAYHEGSPNSSVNVAEAATSVGTSSSQHVSQ